MQNFGLIVYGTQTGLGYQTRAIYNNLQPKKSLLVNLRRYNGFPVNHNWYKYQLYSDGIPSNAVCEELVDDIDTVFVCETPLNYHLFGHARRAGVRIIQQPNPEFFDYFKHYHWTHPDIVALPTVWMREEIESLSMRSRVIVLPVPYEPVPFPNFRKSKQIIGHIVGRPTYSDRNGTLLFLEMIERLGDSYEYHIYYQTPQESKAIKFFAPINAAIAQIIRKQKIKITVKHDIEDNHELYQDIDVLMLPRRYGGLCLPAKEAMERAIPVLMPNVSPNSSILPLEWQYECRYKETLPLHANVRSYESDVDSMISVLNDLDIEKASKEAYNIACEQSWARLKQKYIDILQK